MNQVIAYAKLPFKINIEKAKSEVGLQLSKEQPHFNTAHYTGEWTVINLRSSGGKQDSLIPELRGDEVYMDTELMEQCSAIKMFIQSLECPVMSVRLLNLKKGASIREHRDAELSFEQGEARLHVPLFTNSQVEFFVDGRRVIMQESECWYINANLLHKVSNFGETDRIHLVVDCKVNEWLTTNFNSIPKSYSKKAVKTDQVRMIIRELRIQNTETSNQLADKYEEQLVVETSEVKKPIFPLWLPYKIHYNDSDIILQWVYTDQEPFTDPFFEETILKCKRLSENSRPFKSVSDFSILKEWADSVDSVEPTAFIFHISRCGSTLVSQLLSLNEENISFSEVPVFDDILQLPFKGHDKTLVNQILPEVIKLYGGKRTGIEKRMFIKTDSWHVLFYEELRALYPNTPFIIIYRNPSEVIFSQHRQKGMHAVRDLVNPAIFGFDEGQFNKFHYDHHISLVLEKYFSAIIEISKRDKDLLLLNYNQGMIDIMQEIADFVQIELTDVDRELFSKRCEYHAKNSQQVFEEKFPAKPVATPNLKYLEDLYTHIEQSRQNP